MQLPLPFVHLEKDIAIHFNSKELLVRALTHRSAARASREHGHNERLEFLGDAVLELVASEFLFGFKDKNEGQLTAWRSMLVRGEHLATVSKEFKLGLYINMSKGEEASGGREKESNLANATEALIGAVFLDQGYDAAQQFCDRFILSRFTQLASQGKDKDHKSLFQEKAQEKLGITPHYELIDEEGPDHNKEFIVTLCLGSDCIAKGTGKSKQRAEQDAAKNALKVKGWT
jgi:ribonuclease III